jgi:putative transcriptional regulator
MIKHHLNDRILMAYSAGLLSEAFNLVVATHISFCDECRATLGSYDTVGGVLLENGILETDDTAADGLDQATLPDLQATFALIKLSASAPNLVPQARSVDTPAPLAAYIGDTLDNIKWKPVGMGVKQSILRTSAQATARMLFIPAGAAVPNHGHNGNELTLVLRGAYSDESDRFQRGDVEIADEEMQHTPIADRNEDCICLAVTDAPLRFSGLLPRLMQPLLRI